MSTHKRSNKVKKSAFNAHQPVRGQNQQKSRSDLRPAASKNVSQNTYLFGRHAVMAALKHNKRKLITLWLAKEDVELEKIAAQNTRLTVKRQEKQWFDTTFPNQNHQSVALECGDLAPTPITDVLNHPRLLMLDQITDPHNLGAILRSADAFGFGAVLIPAHNSAPLTDIVAKTACGALETVPVIDVGNLNQTLKQLQQNDFWCVGLAGEATQTLPEFTAGKLPTKICVVMGSEGEGLRRMVRENCDELVKIPMIGSVESLNVSVATGVTLAALMKKV